MISDAQGNMEEAIHFFRNGRIKRWDGRLYYPQINANLAVLLMAEADQRTGNSKDRSKRYAEAVELLSEAREFIPLFEENYLDLYINAQLRSGDISEQRALDIINEALALQADNSKLYFRAAEILADLQRLDEALVYAEEARIRGDKRSILTMVNIFLTKSQFQDALDLLATLTPESPREQMISDVLRARALKHNPKYARELLQPYEDLRNSFVIYARIQIELNAAENEQGTARQECIAVAEQILRENQQFYDRKLFKPLVEQMQRLQNLGSPT
jgi:tetratricopeptide (TPR) repeat protein